MNLYLIGRPVKHSLSPLIHNYWLKKYKKKEVYGKLDLDEQDLQEIINKGEEWQRKFAKEIGLFLEKEEVAFDIVNHRSAPPGLRIWTGATVESSDVEKLLPWIDWAYKQALTNIDSN